MTPLLGFHMHQWEPYHLTEIFYLNIKRQSHLRIFEYCMICKCRRSKDLAPNEIPPFLVLEQS